MAIIPKGKEPSSIKKRLDILFPKLNQAYPDKKISGLYKDHKNGAKLLQNCTGLQDTLTALLFLKHTAKRIVDSYSKNVIREAKYGYQSLSKFIQNEINKDVWILNNTSVKSIEWHFYWSEVSQTGGPSGPLLKELTNRGIKVFFH